MLPGIGKADEKLAKLMQEKLVDFIRYFDPNPEDSEEWPVYGNDSRKVGTFGHLATASPYKPADVKFAVEDDPMTDATKQACDFWSSAPYYPDGVKPRLVEQKNVYHPGL